MKNLIFLFIAVSNLVSCKDQNPFGEDQNYSDGVLNKTFLNDEEAVLSYEIYKKEEEKLLADCWESNEIENGQLSMCSILKQKKSNLVNYLKVVVGSGKDVVIKVMNLKTDNCIQYIFINSGSTYLIKNIPKGEYYLKIAYGKNWFSKVQNNQCVGEFLRNPLYEKGVDTLNFKLQHSEGGYSIHSFSLHLDVISNELSNSVNYQNFSDEEFNK